MRYHCAFQELAIPVGGQSLQDAAGAQSLAAARFEPVIRAGKGGGVLDVHLRRGDRRAVIPLVIVDVAMLEARERDPLVWPQFARQIGIDDVAIGRRLEAWLAELLESRRLNAEAWEIFGDASDRDAFENARRAGFLGAAALEDVARRAAPFVFARRHVRARDVVIACRDAGLGAAILAPVARRVRIAGGEGTDIAWYAPPLSEAEAEIAIVDGPHRDSETARSAHVLIDLDGAEGALRVEPAPFVPLDAMFDFSGGVRRTERAFSVKTTPQRKTRPLLLPPEYPIGGSTGRILFVLRRGASRFGGADVDYAELVAAAMRDEGFTVGIIDDLNQARDLAPDLLHAFGLADAAQAAAARRLAASLDVPFAIHPFYDAPALGGYWGATVTPYCYRFMQDETSIEGFLDLMRQRRLALNTITATAPFHPTNPGWESDVRDALSGADVVYVGGRDEAEAIKALCGNADVVCARAPVWPEDCQPKAIEALVGAEPFVLLHAPIESTQNQLQAVRAAQIADLNLVVAGPIADADYAALVRAFAGDRTLVVGDPDAAALEGLYRATDVFLDVAWVGCGPVRAARAFSRGAALVISSRMHPADLAGGEFVFEADPADAEGIARGLGNAWYRRREEPEGLEAARLDFIREGGVRAVTSTIVAGYATALERRNLLAVR